MSGTTLASSKSALIARTARVSALVALWLVATLVATTSAHAAYAGWQFQGPGDGFVNIDQVIVVQVKAPTTFFAEQFGFTGTSSNGYIGLQTDGGRLDGSIGETAIFSLWDATAAAPGPGARCQTFTGEGEGYSCRLAYPFVTGTPYQLRVWRLEADRSGQWWGGWVTDLSTNWQSYLGKIRVPHRSRPLIGGPLNFIEYFGPGVANCGRVPRSTAYFTQPAADFDGMGGYQYYSRLSSWWGDCTAGDTADWHGWHGVSLTHGRASPPTSTPSPPTSTPSPPTSRCQIVRARRHVLARLMRSARRRLTHARTRPDQRRARRLLRSRTRRLAHQRTIVRRLC